MAISLSCITPTRAGGNGGRYVAVHLRWLEGKCVGRAQGYYVKEAAGPIGAMCSNR